MGEAGGDDVERNVEVVAELFEIVGRGFIGDVFHAYMSSLNAESWAVDFRTPRQHLEQAERILATRKAHKYMIAVLKKAIGDKGFHETLAYAPFQSAQFCLHVQQVTS